MDYLTAFRKRYGYDDPLEGLRIYTDSYIKPYISYGEDLEIINNNIHTILFGLALYSFLYQLSKVLLLVPLISKTLKSRKHRIDFSIRVVSFIQAIVICVLSIPVFCNKYLDEDHVFASTPYSRFYTSMALSYFIWDTAVSLYYVAYFGIGFLLHGIVSTLVFGVASNYKLIHYYSGAFLLFEISTPFLNVRWVGLKFDILPESVKLVNNIILILIFFFIRICWGWYQVFKLAVDFYYAKNDPRFTAPGAILILTCNFVLDILNVFWFSKMMIVAITTLKQMFGVTKKDQEDEKLKLM